MGILIFLAALFLVSAKAIEGIGDGVVWLFHRNNRVLLAFYVIGGSALVWHWTGH